VYSGNAPYLFANEADLRAFDVMSNAETTQTSWESWGGFSSWEDYAGEAYMLDKPSSWKSLQGDVRASFSGRMIGGCLDVLSVLIGTRFAPVEAFIEKYKQDGFIWAIESAEMSAANIYRALWQMRECGWFRYCNGIVYGRPDGYKDTQDFTLIDALRQGLGGLNVPIIFDADIGHIPPQMQIVNGAMGKVEFADGKATVRQLLK
jgi:muramoyltetrapeptide carboxypeptidase LdcA involved in peptidoglycan recycling